MIRPIGPMKKIRTRGKKVNLRGILYLTESLETHEPKKIFIAYNFSLKTKPENCLFSKSTLICWDCFVIQVLRIPSHSAKSEMEHQISIKYI